jgi:hypothetical protein
MPDSYRPEQQTRLHCDLPVTPNTRQSAATVRGTVIERSNASQHIRAGIRDEACILAPAAGTSADIAEGPYCSSSNRGGTWLHSSGVGWASRKLPVSTVLKGVNSGILLTVLNEC